MHTMHIHTCLRTIFDQGISLAPISCCSIRALRIRREQGGLPTQGGPPTRRYTTIQLNYSSARSSNSSWATWRLTMPSTRYRIHMGHSAGVCFFVLLLCAHLPHFYFAILYIAAIGRRPQASKAVVYLDLPFMFHTKGAQLFMLFVPFVLLP